MLRGFGRAVGLCQRGDAVVWAQLGLHDDRVHVGVRVGVAGERVGQTGHGQRGVGGPGDGEVGGALGGGSGRGGGGGGGGVGGVGAGHGGGLALAAVQLAGVSACRLDMRIWELLLLSMDSCVPPFTPLLANEGCRCFRSTAKYRFTVQLRHFLLISDCTLRDILHNVIINGPRWKDTSDPSSLHL